MRKHISELLSKGFFLLVFETFVINHPEIKTFLDRTHCMVNKQCF